MKVIGYGESHADLICKLTENCICYFQLPKMRKIGYCEANKQKYKDQETGNCFL